MVSGLMMQIAMQIGLHRPSHAQDFTKFHVELRHDELRDRVKTWAACNVVVQRVSTGYGQPPRTVYDWTLTPGAMGVSGFRLPAPADERLRIEMIADRVTRALYGNPNDPVGLAGTMEKPALVGLFARELDDFESTLALGGPRMNRLYIAAVRLHLRLAVLFDAPTTKTYVEDLLTLYAAVLAYLNQAVDLHDPSGASLLRFSSNYIVQLIIAAGFALLKLLNHRGVAKLVDRDEGARMFGEAVRAIRKISVAPNDLPSRLAEVLAQLWRASGAGSRPEEAHDTDSDQEEESLQLKVRCRMSMSVVYDSVWRWREEFLAKGKGSLDRKLTPYLSPPPNYRLLITALRSHELTLPL